MALGAASWFVLARRFGLSAMAPGPLALAIVGALLPDIDHPKSWVGRRLRPLSDVAGRLLGHRGLTHSACAIAACVWLMAGHRLPETIAAPLAVGYLSHLMADFLTPGGLRLAWPMRRTWAIPLCRTGSVLEALVVGLMLAGLWFALRNE